MGVQRKLAALVSLKPDVAIVPECGQALTLPEGGTFAWVGSNATKGLGVFGFGAYCVSLDESFDSRLQWAAPVHVQGPVPFALVAIWAHNHRAKSFHPL